MRVRVRSRCEGLRTKVWVDPVCQPESVQSGRVCFCPASFNWLNAVYCVSCSPTDNTNLLLMFPFVLAAGPWMSTCSGSSISHSANATCPARSSRLKTQRQLQWQQQGQQRRRQQQQQGMQQETLRLCQSRQRHVQLLAARRVQQAAHPPLKLTGVRRLRHTHYSLAYSGVWFDCALMLCVGCIGSALLSVLPDMASQEATRPPAPTLQISSFT
jgi:hypothetical protein